MKWKFCEFCYINGHCENQDRGHKCECYGKKLEDKCERLEKQLNVAKEALEGIEKNGTDSAIQTITTLCVNNWLWAHKALKEIEELEK